MLKSDLLTLRSVLLLLSEKLINFFACVYTDVFPQREAISFTSQSWRFLSWRFKTQKKGSGLMKCMFGPCFASSSPMSFPSEFVCSGTHISDTVFCGQMYHIPATWLIETQSYYYISVLKIVGYFTTTSM